MKVSLAHLLPDAARGSYAIAACNVFSVEWAQAVIRAAEQVGQAVIIMANRAMVSHIPPRHVGPIFSDMAETATVPVCVHLDHNTDMSVMKEAIDHGFSSIMYDGSHLPLKENIAHTIEARELAHNRGVSIEGEIGSVRYTDVSESETVYTDPSEAEIFAQETQVDALAISVGTTHRMVSKGADIQYDRIRDIAEKVSTPLVIHGTSGILHEDIIKMKRYPIAKFNIGTTLRQSFAQGLRETLAHNETLFDFYDITHHSYECVAQSALDMILLLKDDGG